MRSTRPELVERNDPAISFFFHSRHPQALPLRLVIIRNPQHMGNIFKTDQEIYIHGQTAR